MKQFLLTTLFLCIATLLTNAQSITNVRFEQSGNQIAIYYDLSAEAGSRWNIDIYCSQNGGKTWSSALKYLGGDYGHAQIPGINKKAIWDVIAELAEGETLKGDISFKVEATKEKVIFPREYYKYKSSKNFWLVSALLSGTAGTFAYIQSENYYSQYKEATTGVSDLRQKVQLYETIYPIAFGVAGLCTLEFIIKAGKQGKVKKQTLSWYPVPLNQGAGINLVCKF